MTPNEIAEELGYRGQAIRAWLRKEGRRPESAKWSRWILTAEDEGAIRLAFPARTGRLTDSPGRPGAAGVVASDWEYEGSVVAAAARHLESAGWTVDFMADTRSHEAGDDIRATLNGRTLRVEAKGWPSDGYADPRRSREKKRTNPNTQAVHWYAAALLRVVRNLGLHPDAEVAIALPDKPRYRALLDETQGSLGRLGIGVLLVCSDGTVVEHLAGYPSA
jgi:hypothetical protein